MKEKTLNALDKAFSKYRECISVDIYDICSFISLYRAGEYIYPDVLRRNLKISKEASDKILEILEKENIVEKYFQYYCMACGKPVGMFMQNLTPAYCPECDYELDKKIYIMHIK